MEEKVVGGLLPRGRGSFHKEKQSFLEKKHPDSTTLWGNFDGTCREGK